MAGWECRESYPCTPGIIARKGGVKCYIIPMASRANRKGNCPAFIPLLWPVYFFLVSSKTNNLSSSCSSRTFLSYGCSKRISFRFRYYGAQTHDGETWTSKDTPWTEENDRWSWHDKLRFVDEAWTGWTMRTPVNLRSCRIFGALLYSFPRKWFTTRNENRAWW